MKCLRKVKTANAWFQNGTFTGFLAFEMNSSPIHVHNTIQVPSFCTVSPFYLPFYKALSPFLALVTISKYVLPNLGSTYLPYNISSVAIRWTCLCPYDLWPCFQITSLSPSFNTVFGGIPIRDEILFSQIQVRITTTRRRKSVVISCLLQMIPARKPAGKTLPVAGIQRR